MKIYIMPRGITMVGKAWEIRAKLKEYAKEYRTVEEWGGQKRISDFVKRSEGRGRIS